jgi:mono/diheme cytochrome c family protein
MGWRLAICVVALALGACEPAPEPLADAGDCPNLLPASAEACSTALPSYSADIAPIFTASCISCHGVDGGPSYYPLTTYAESASVRTQILEQVLVCLMPPSPAVLSDAERAAVLTWVSCGAPNN